MNFTNRAEKADKKCGYLSSSHASFLDLRSLHTLSKKNCIFCNFVLTSARKVCVLKQFTYMDLRKSSRK